MRKYTPSKHINPFPSFNPFDPSDTANYKNWVKDAYGFIVDVEARFNGIELVTSVELSISRGDKRLVVSTKTIDRTVPLIEASLRILGINTRSGNLGIARFHIPHSLMLQKVTELDALSNLTGRTQPFKIEISVKGTRGAVEYADQRSLLTKPMWNLKNLKPNSMSMDTYLYGGQISSFGTSNLVDFVFALATAVDATDSPFKDNPDTTQVNDGYGPFRINDGSNPYGGKLHPHETHSNGETLDIITFGGTVLGGDYDYVPNKNTTLSNEFVAANTSRRYNDIFTLLKYGKDQTDPDGGYMHTEASCKISFSAEQCKHRLTVEKCLYSESPVNPPVGHDLSQCKGIPPLAASDRLARWVQLNRDGITKLKSIAPNIKQFSSSGFIWFESLLLKTAAYIPPNTPPASRIYDRMTREQTTNIDLLSEGILPNEMTLRYPNETNSVIMRTPFSPFSVNMIDFRFNDDGHYNHHHISRTK